MYVRVRTDEESIIFNIFAVEAGEKRTRALERIRWHGLPSKMEFKKSREIAKIVKF